MAAPNQRVTPITYSFRVIREVDLFTDLYFCVKINAASLWATFVFLVGISLSVKEYPIVRIFDKRNQESALLILEDIIFLGAVIFSIPEQLLEPFNLTYFVGEALIIICLILYKYRKSQLKINTKKFRVLIGLIIVLQFAIVIIDIINLVNWVILHSKLTIASAYNNAMLLSFVIAGYICSKLEKIKING